jgi:hypothetical protein
VLFEPVAGLCAARLIATIGSRVKAADLPAVR